MNHIQMQAAKLGLKRSSRRKSQPYDGFTKGELWDRLQEAEKRLKAAGAAANRLGKDLHHQDVLTQLQASEQAYAIRETVLAADRGEVTKKQWSKL